MTETERELQFARGHIGALEQLLEVHEQTALEQSMRLEQSRAELLRVFDQSPAAIASTVGPDHVFQSANTKYSELVGNRKLVGLPARTAFPELAAPGGLLDLLDKVFESGVPIIGTEVAVPLDRTGTGETELYYFNFVYQPLFETKERVWGIMVHAVEVTEQVVARRRLEETARDLRILTDALERSNKELDQFAYVASHDLKAPLRGIANLAQWIQEDIGEKLTGDSVEHMRLLHGRVQRMEALIDGILTYSRAARVKLAAEPVDTGKLVCDVVDLIAPEGVEIKVADRMPTVLAEKVPLQQVFMNLIGNAIKYGRGDPAVVTVSATEEDGLAKFSICDNGPGIAPEFHERIWGIFQTLEARDKIEGTGIGLAVVRKIVESRGGRAWVESHVGKGACFYFTWMLADKGEMQ